MSHPRLYTPALILPALFRPKKGPMIHSETLNIQILNPAGTALHPTWRAWGLGKKVKNPDKPYTNSRHPHNTLNYVLSSPGPPSKLNPKLLKTIGPFSPVPLKRSRLQFCSFLRTQTIIDNHHHRHHHHDNSYTQNKNNSHKDSNSMSYVFPSVGLIDGLSNLCGGPCI